MSTLNIYNSLKLIIKSLIILIFTTQMSYGAYLNLTWNANTEEDLAGYKVYYGTSSGNYGTHNDVGNITEYELADLNEGTIYYIALTAYDNSNNESEKSDEVSGVAQAPPDTQNPTITVKAPTSSSTYSTSNSTTNIGGTASDNVGVTQVTWSNNRGGSGKASGTTNWSVSNITLREGNNTITVTARDAAGNTSTDTITITYTPTTTSTTTSIQSGQKEYCSTDPVLVLHDSIPEEGTMSITISDDLENTISATLFLTLYDPDISGEGYIYLNDNDPIDLPVGNYNNLEHSFEVPINVDWLTQGENSFRFTHVATWGYEVRELCVRVTLTTSPDTTTTPSTTTTVVSITTTTTTPVTTTTSSPSTTTSVAPTTTTTILPDNTPPTGTITINNGDKRTHSPNVTLTLFATDDGEELGGDTLMTFSNDNQEWSDPETYTVTKMWTLTPGKGDKTVCVKFRDAAGNWMIEPAKDQIRFEESEDTCDDLYKFQPASVTASSEFLPFRAKGKAVDGNHLTFWSTSPSPFRKNEFITLDLGEIKQMSRIDMYALRFLTMDFFPVNFQIQISRDNINWEEIRTEKNYTLKSSHYESGELNSLEARYIRVSITKAKTFFIFYLAQIAEIEVYGCDIPEQHFTPLDTPSIEDGEPRDTIQEEVAEAAESDQAPPSVPGRPVITFN